MSEVTRILDAVERGEAQADRELLPLVYAELRRIAAHMEEAASALGLSKRTAESLWTYARAWLSREIRSGR